MGVPPAWTQKLENPAIDEQIAPFKKFCLAGTVFSFLNRSEFHQKFISKCKLKTCPHCTKTCPHWTCFGSNYPINGVGLAVTLDKNFKFSKVLLSPKFKHNSMSMAVKKKKFYCIFNLTLDIVNILLQCRVNDVVENFFLHFYTDWIIMEFWG